MYQFNRYLLDIPEIEKMFQGGNSESKQKDITTTEELIKLAKQKGLKTPSKF